MSSQDDLSDKEKHRQAFILISKYMSLYKEAHGKRPVVNRYAAKWGMADVVEGIGYDRALEVLAFYFRTKGSHSLEFFYKNFDKLDNNLTLFQADKERRARLLMNTKKRVEEGSHQ
jgi:hypothetical protein